MVKINETHTKQKIQIYGWFKLTQLEGVACSMLEAGAEILYHIQIFVNL